MDCLSKLVLRRSPSSLFQYLNALRNSLFCRLKAESNDNGNEKPQKSVDSRDHMERTQNKKRQYSIMPATVDSIENLSSSVKGLKLKVENCNQFELFQAGQWLDLMIPGVKTVGGFSICNSPGDFQNDGCIELAVKYSDHPPAYWIHSKCEVGSKVQIRIGGEFAYKNTKNSNVLLIAGGVGINPLLSILRHRRNLFLGDSNNSQHYTALLYSVKSKEHLIFENEIRKISNEIPMHSQLHFTKSNESLPDLPSSITISHDKISRDSIHEFMKCHDISLTDCYICGPPKFIDCVLEYLIELGCLNDNIFYERWW